jgi:hypothetical protein
MRELCLSLLGLSKVKAGGKTIERGAEKCWNSYKKGQ